MDTRTHDHITHKTTLFVNRHSKAGWESVAKKDLSVYLVSYSPTLVSITVYLPVSLSHTQLIKAYVMLKDKCEPNSVSSEDKTREEE